MGVTPTIRPEVVDEFLRRLDKEGKSKEYIDGAIEGMSFAVELAVSLKKLEAIKARLIEEENAPRPT